MTPLQKPTQPTYAELEEMTELARDLDERTGVERRLHEFRQQERSAALDRVRDLVRVFKLQPVEAFPSLARQTLKVPAKYVDPTTGETWSGRGKTPAWLLGKNKADYLIR